MMDIRIPVTADLRGLVDAVGRAKREGMMWAAMRLRVEADEAGQRGNSVKFAMWRDAADALDRYAAEESEEGE